MLTNTLLRFSSRKSDWIAGQQPIPAANPVVCFTKTPQPYLSKQHRPEPGRNMVRSQRHGAQSFSRRRAKRSDKRLTRPSAPLVRPGVETNLVTQPIVPVEQRLLIESVSRVIPENRLGIGRGCV